MSCLADVMPPAAVDRAIMTPGDRVARAGGMLKRWPHPLAPFPRGDYIMREQRARWFFSVTLAQPEFAALALLRRGSALDSGARIVYHAG